MAARGHRVAIYTARPPGPAPEGNTDPDGPAVHWLRPLLRVGNAPLLPQLPRALPADTDLVHLHYPFYFGAEAVALTCRARGMPYVLTYHQDVILGGPLAGAVALHHRTLERFVLQGAAAVMPTSLDYARHSWLRPLLERQPERVVPVPNGVDTQTFSPGPPEPAVLARFGVPPGVALVLFVARLDRAHWFKGLDVAVEAIARLPETSAHLVVVGDGELRAPSERLARQRAPGRVTFCGAVSTAELVALLRAGHLLVMPSVTMGEAFGLAALEAMACGRPVVASNLPGVRTVVEDGSTGLLVPRKDPEALAGAISSLLTQPELRERLGTAARCRALEYDWSRVADQLEAVYRTVVAAAPRREGLSVAEESARSPAASRR